MNDVKLTYRFDDGSFIIASFIFWLNYPTPFLIPVIGGSGDYMGAAGQNSQTFDFDKGIVIDEFEIYTME